MSTFDHFKIHTVHPIAVKLVLIATAIIVVFASLDFISDQLATLMPNAEAAHVETITTDMPANPGQQSWSEEWFKVHMTIPASLADDIPTF
jgi:hypothetical protein